MTNQNNNPWYLDTNEVTTLEEYLGPPKIEPINILMMSLWGFISGIIGWLFVFAFSYFLLSNDGLSGSSPIVLSMIAFFCFAFANYLLMYFYSIVFPEKYTNSRIIFTQISIFSIILYILISPMYMYASAQVVPKLVLFVFIFHNIMNVLWVNLILDIISNYRYILLNIYGTLIGTIISVFLTLFIFSGFTDSTQALYALIGSVILAFTWIVTCKILIVYAYHIFYKNTGSDFIGNIFQSLEDEEKKIEKYVETTLTKF